MDPGIYISGMRIVLCVFFFFFGLLVALPKTNFFVPPSPFLVGSWDHMFFQVSQGFSPLSPRLCWTGAVNVNEPTLRSSCFVSLCR